MKDSGQSTIDPQAVPREDLPEILELEDEFQETGLDLATDDARGFEPAEAVRTGLDQVKTQEAGPRQIPEAEHHVEELRRPGQSRSIIEDLLCEPVAWCLRCGARHSEKLCLGELAAAEPERHAWRVAVDTGAGRKVHGVLLAPTGDYWRARVMTFPRTLWVVPGGNRTLKFIGRDPYHAESQAIAFVKEHCEKMSHVPVDDPALIAEPNPVGLEQTKETDEAEAMRRKLRTVLVRFGPQKPNRRAKTSDLSEKGLFIATSEPYARRTRLNLLLEVSGARIPLQGTVQWTRSMPAPGRPEGMGIRLIRPPAFYVEFVRRLP